MENEMIQIPMDKLLEREVSPRAILIYGLLLHSKNDVIPYEELAKTLSTSLITVRNCIKSMEKLGWITIEKKGRNNVYTFL